MQVHHHMRTALPAFARRIDALAENPFSKKYSQRSDRVRRFTTGVISLIVAWPIEVLDAARRILSGQQSI
ncbi:hypothetical protein JQ625_14240 [Bradyrhizobium diazoefficiens]|nr:hypothetical protein [Bradyrhizobium diazoefficiens]MBR0775993.1 hypothetical protein [Bradyrhizobium diazoefficiens]